MFCLIKSKAFIEILSSQGFINLFIICRYNQYLTTYVSCKFSFSELRNDSCILLNASVPYSRFYTMAEYNDISIYNQHMRSIVLQIKELLCIYRNCLEFRPFHTFAGVVASATTNKLPAS